MACRGDLKDEAARIRAALAMGYSVAAVAKIFGCTPSAVRKVRDGEVYGASPGRPGPKPGAPAERVEASGVQGEAWARMQRALSHWQRNTDMEAGEVAEMYGVTASALRQARERQEKE